MRLWWDYDGTLNDQIFTQPQIIFRKCNYFLHQTKMLTINDTILIKSHIRQTLYYLASLKRSKTFIFLATNGNHIFHHYCFWNSVVAYLDIAPRGLTVAVRNIAWNNCAQNHWFNCGMKTRNQNNLPFIFDTLNPISVQRSTSWCFQRTPNVEWTSFYAF